MDIIKSNLSAICTRETVLAGSGIFTYRVYVNDTNSIGNWTPSRTVRTNNTAPNITDSLPINTSLVIDEGENNSFLIAYHDINLNPLVVNWYINDVLTLTHPGNGTSLIHFLSNFTSAGNYTILAQVSDGALNSNVTWNLSVNDINVPPSFSGAITNQFWYTVNEQASNETIDLSHFFFDFDNDPLTYRFNALDNITAMITGDLLVITSDKYFSGTREAQINASDGNVTVSSNLFTLRVSLDQDFDGEASDDFGGIDCDDTDPSVWAGKSCDRSGYIGATIDALCFCSGGTVIRRSSGGGGGGTVYTPSVDPSSDNTFFSTIEKGIPQSHTVRKEKVPLHAYTFRTNKKLTSVSVSIKPTNKSYGFNALSFFEVSLDKMTDFDILDVVLQVRINRSEVFDYVIVYRKEGQIWKQLSTNPSGMDNDYFYFNATSPGFSLFAIKAMTKPPAKNKTVVDDKKTEETPLPKNLTNERNLSKDNNVIVSKNETPKQKIVEQPRPIGLKYVNYGLIIFMSLGIMTTYTYTFYTRRKKMHGLRVYIASRLEHGFEEEHIKEDLRNLGWGEKHISQQLKHAHIMEKFRKLEIYIESSINEGHKEEHIRKELEDQGWKKDNIHKYTKKVKDKIQKLKSLDKI